MSQAQMKKPSFALSMGVRAALVIMMIVGFGIMFPAYNTLFVNLAPNSQRGTATSTYLTSWDVGIGIGMLAGGYIAEVSSFDRAYLFGACLITIRISYDEKKRAICRDYFLVQAKYAYSRNGASL